MLHRLTCIAGAAAIACAALAPATTFAANNGKGQTHSHSVGSKPHAKTTMKTTTKTFKSTSTKSHAKPGKSSKSSHSHRRHHWHGKWWAYGVGPCWSYDDDADSYVWTCGDDD